MLDYWIDLLVEAGIDSALMNTHAQADLVRRHIQTINRGARVKLVETYEPRLLGSAGTIAANPEFADDADDVIIIYADNRSDVDLRRLLTFHRSHVDPVTMLLFHAPNPSACGIVELDPAGRIIDFVEKPAVPKSDLANGGIYVFRRDAFQEIAAMGAFDIGFEVLPKFVGRMRGFVHDGYHLDVGTLEAYERAKADAAAVASRSRPYKGTQRPAVFLDRDGTIIHEVSYLSRPDQVRLIDGAAEAIAQLQSSGFACVVVTNQSAVGRGFISEGDLDRIHAEMNAQLARHGVRLDGIYHCSTVPHSADRTVVECVNRKPGPGMLWRAAIELGLDLSESWMVGDMISDVLAGLNAQCRGSVLVKSGDPFNGAAGDVPAGTLIHDDLRSAATRICQLNENR